MSVIHQYESRPPVIPGEEVGCRLEAEGRSASPPQSPPAYLQWATSLHVLLADPLGEHLFSQYLKQEGPAHADALNFWYACKGLHKETDKQRILTIVRVIYRRFFLRSQLPLSESLRKMMLNRLKKLDSNVGVHIFDEAQKEIEMLINQTAYPNFLKSDIYIDYIRSMENGSGERSEGGGGMSSGGSVGAGPKPTTLATLHEDQELDTSAPVFPPLTRDSLMLTQRVRASELRPQTEAYADYLHSKTGVKMYCSYNPVSRQDSELQSLSSDARTESDNMSLTDSSIDGMSLNHIKMTRRQCQMHYRKVKEAASLNRDSHQTIIPRTERVEREQFRPMKPVVFAALLTQKLEAVLKAQEAQEILNHKLFDSKGVDRSLAEACMKLRETFPAEDDDVQHILDQHVSRVWSDFTPGGRSPGSPPSPDPHSRRTNKVTVNGGSAGHPMGTYPQGSHSRSHVRHVKKEKDAFSTFSSDSGNVHDFSEGFDHRLHLPKSKSMPDYSESSDAYSSLPGHGRQGSREWLSRRYCQKPELTDSGVSVVSESISHHSAQCKERVLCWLMENEHKSYSDRDSSCNSSRMDFKHSVRSNPSNKGRRSPPCETVSHDESRRRMEECNKVKSRQRMTGNCKLEGAVSAGSTLRSSKSDFTTVVFSFCDEQFPYRSKIPGTGITLKQFKEFLPKKGNYRYYFKTECEELGMRVIQEEITDDNEVLPLWEGKVMAQVKPID